MAPSSVPIVSAPLSASFMLPVPDASLPAVEICSERSAAGNDPLGERDAVVGQEGDLELVAHARVGVDLRADGVDRPDDVLRHVVARRGLGREDEDAGLHVERRVLQDAAVKGEDVQQIQVLALVLVQALDLHVEDRVRGDRRRRIPPG